jgi:phosphohistidine phosphatase SixA
MTDSVSPAVLGVPTHARRWLTRSAKPGCYDLCDMDKDLTQLRRRPFFFPLVLPLLLLGAVIAAGVWLFDARSSTVIVIVRHAEVEPTGDTDPALSVDGRERAARLARMLSQAQPVRGIDSIFASELRRTQQTVIPISEMLALPVNVVPSAAWGELPGKILREHRGEYVLVAGHSNTIPTLIKALTGEDVTIRDDEHDVMFIVFAPQVSKRKVVRLRY